MHAKRAQYGSFRRNILCRTLVFHRYIVWFQLTHLHECWRISMAYYCTNARTLKLLLTHQLVYRDTLWHNRTNIRLFPDGEVFTHIMPYINTIQCYWRVICSAREFILSITFIILIYLKDYQEENLYRFLSLQARTNYSKHKTWIQHKNKKYRGKVEGMVESKPSCPPEVNK